MTEVFVSYKAEDRPRVRSLVEALEAEGLSIWWDARVGGGEDWRDMIAEQLNAAQCVIVVWSKRSTGPEGRFVRDEATRALRKGVYLPVTIDRVEPPLGFGETQVLDLSGWKDSRSDSRYQAVLAGVHSVLGREAPPVTAAASRVQVSRRALFAGGGAAIAAAGAGAWLAFGPHDAKSDSIAVLPFANLSGDPAQDYFSDGLAEELRSALSLIAGLKVVARTSSEMLRSADVKDAARELSVANILTGSVRRSRSIVRISAQLIDGASGLGRWSQSFDRPTGDVLEIQADIAENVARALRVELGGVDPSALSVGGTSSPEAQDFYLQSLEGNRDESEATLHRVLATIDKAIALDPSYAQAHARRALILNNWASTYATSVKEAQRGRSDAAASARRAIALAPRMASGYTALGFVHRDQLNFGEALRALRQADALRGNEVQSLTNYAVVLVQAGRQDEALARARRAVSLDPLNHIPLETQTIVLYYSRSYRQAVEAARRALKIAPKRVRVKSFLGNSLLLLGRLEDAALAYAKLDTYDYRRLVGEAAIAARRGQRGEALQALKAIEQRFGNAASYQYAQITAQLGEPDRAIGYLDAAWTARDPGLANIKVDPFLDPLRKDPRLAGIAARLRFP